MSEETRHKVRKALLGTLAIVFLAAIFAGPILSGGDTVLKEPTTLPETNDSRITDETPDTDDHRPLPSKVATFPEARNTTVVLSITKIGPATVLPGEPITYTLAVTNSGDSIATGLIITDVLPGGAHYIGGGTLMLADMVGWTVDSLAPDDSVQVQFAVTATQTITNSNYRVSCAEGASATGSRAVVTSAGHRVYQPLIQGGNGSAASYTYTIVSAYPHDPDAFTQGLVYEDGVLYEGTGLRGRSTLRRVVLETGEVLQSYDLPSEYFGEGITIYGDRIIQLTWQSRVGFVYDKASFELLQEFTYPTEGWGMTYDGERLIMSDGTSTLYFWDPETLEEVGQVDVYDESGPVVKLNELEYIQGEVYANIWLTDSIAKIDPQTGRVTGWIDLTGLLDPGSVTQPVNVLNGIAYDPQNDRLFVTGKLWPALFEIDLVAID
jgi:uncharacterized repeat protein (TIGR01451 family)